MKKYKAPDELLQITQHDGPSYLPLVDFESWRVAILNHAPSDNAWTFNEISAHRMTDEVFVLLSGQALLFTADDELKNIYVEELKPYRIYNVGRDVLHNHILAPGAKILIVENRDTTVENGRYIPMTQEKKRIVNSMVNEIWKK